MYTELEVRHGDLDKRLSMAEVSVKRNINLLDTNRKYALDSKSNVVDGVLATSGDKKVLALPEEARHMLAEGIAEAEYEETLSLFINTNDNDALFQSNEAGRVKPGFLKARLKQGLRRHLKVVRQARMA